MPAAESQLSLNVGRVEGLPDAVCRSRPGHWNALLGAASASRISGIWLMLKMAMMIR